jgi:hypothetical protein
MARRRALGLLALPVIVIALMSPLSPVAVSSAGAEEESSGDLLVLNVRGTANRKAGTAPERFAYATPKGRPCWVTRAPAPSPAGRGGSGCRAGTKPASSPTPSE